MRFRNSLSLDHPRVWGGVLAVCIAALLLIAWLQYKWIGEVAVAEQERARAQLIESVQRFRDEFNQEIGRLFASLIAIPDGPGNDAVRLADRYTVLEASGVDLGLVRDIFVCRRTPNGGLDLLRLDRRTASLSRADWPQRFEQLRERLSFVPGSGGPPVTAVLGAGLDAPVLIAPLLRGPRPEMTGAPTEDRRAVGPPAWLLAELDFEFLTRELLPRLQRKHFPAAADTGFALRIVSANDPDRILYNSDPGLPHEFYASPDVVVPILSMPPGPAGTGAGPGGPGSWMRRLRPLPGPGRTLRERPGPPPLWTAIVKHRGGSLEAIVDSARRRNLLVSFAGLAVISVSLAVLLVSTRRAQRLARQQMEFVAGVSHELRTPLSVICSAGDNLADGVVAAEDQVRRYGSVIRGEGRRLSKMIEQVLRFAGIQSERARLNLEPVDIAEVVRAAVAACEPDTRAAGCAVDLQMEDDLPAVQGDTVLLAHCLRNLIDNAATHGARGQWIGVGVRKAGSGAKVEVSVEDHGPGFDNADLARLIQPFYRGRRAIEDHVRGFGLGLALASRIAAGHSGTLTATSTAGKGARFVLTLPAAADQSKA